MPLGPLHSEADIEAMQITKHYQLLSLPTTRPCRQSSRDYDQAIPMAWPDVHVCINGDEDRYNCVHHMPPDFLSYNYPEGDWKMPCYGPVTTGT